MEGRGWRYQTFLLAWRDGHLHKTDAESMSINPKDENSLFRAMSDSLYFTQSRYNEVKEHLMKYINRNSNVRTLKIDCE